MYYLFYNGKMRRPVKIQEIVNKSYQVKSYPVQLN